eukprot:XP_011683057.1 PREDICTED: soluble scavenger receptor cysteine-rich domain-containing protein SSC5D isoform X1 [Strongylocentrotus purpuratus]
MMTERTTMFPAFFLLVLLLLQVVTPSLGLLRLVGGGSNYGRLELFYNGEWGTVCDDNFGVLDAQVACRELGLDTFLTTFYGSARYGAGTGSIWLDEVECTGSELTLDSCSHSTYGITDCSHSEDVSIKCGSLTDGEGLDGSLRLEDGGSNYGRLEVFYSGFWGTVCDDSFDILDARVACRQLGLDTSSINYYTDSRFGSGTGTIWLDEVDCSGSESNLNDCNHDTYGTHDCTHLEDVGISCGATNIGGTTSSSLSGVGSWIGGAIFIIAICVVAVVFRRRRMHAMRQRQNTRFIQPPVTTTVHVTANPNAPGTTPMPTYHHTPTPPHQPGGYPTQTFTPTYPPPSTGGAPPANPYPVQAFPPAAQYPAQPPPGTTPYPPQAGAPYPPPSTAGAPPYPPQSTPGAPPYPPPSAAGAPPYPPQSTPDAPAYPPPSAASAPPYPPPGSAPYPPQQPVDASAAYPPQGGNVPLEDLPPPPSYDDTVRQ